MVADHKGGERQSGMKPIFTAPIFHNLPFLEWLVPVCVDE
jgi:hypothetical protein